MLLAAVAICKIGQHIDIICIPVPVLYIDSECSCHTLDKHYAFIFLIFSLQSGSSNNCVYAVK